MTDEPDRVPDAHREGDVPAVAAGALGELGREATAGLEAMLFLADEPLSAEALAEALEVEPAQAAAAATELAERYDDERRGIEIRFAAGGWRMYSSPLARPVLERWALTGRSGRLTQAALETLAVVAYKQPIGRQEIGDVRGVNADAAVRSLIARGLVAEVGRDPGPGQAILYGTTPLFLERLGLGSLGELPPLTDYLPEAPSPDEPELGALRELRRRLAQGGDLPSSVGPPATEARLLDEPDDEDDTELLPPPDATRAASTDDIDELTDQLERVARSAVSRLRRAVEAQAADDEDDHDADAPEAEEREADDYGERATDVGDAGDERDDDA